MHQLRLTIAALLLALPSAAAAAEARVELVLVTADGFSPLETQNWYRALTEMKVGLTIRGIRSSDKVEIVNRGSKEAPVYRVTGLLNARGELVLPGVKFTLRERARIAEWIEKLKTQGPPGSSTRPVAFGLSADDLAAVREELAHRVTFSTKGADRAEVLSTLTRQMRLSVSQPRGAAAALDEAGPVGEELEGLSAGTVLAYVLRPAGLAWVPRGVRRYEVRAATSVEQLWPVGLPAQDKRREVLPKLFEVINVQIDKGTPLPQALSALQPRLDVPFLLDHNSLAVEEIDIAEATAFVPPKRTSLSIILRTVLAQNKLTSELRVDEAGKPFIWIAPFRRR